MTNLLVNEIFTDAFQGEGRQAGQACSFVRLARCNLHCNFCDTPYTWAYTDRQAALHRDGRKFDPREESHKMSVADILCSLEELRQQPPKGHLVVISGGEPFLQQDALRNLVLGLSTVGYRVAIETAGTIRPTLWTGITPPQWNVSPKLQSSGNDLLKRFNKLALQAFDRMQADFKFVVTNENDITEIRGIQQEIDIPNERMWVMPEGTDATTLSVHTQPALKAAIHYGWNLTLRQHILLYGDERGR
jgi:7-carboxy-7-deazaguanine synthase